MGSCVYTFQYFVLYVMPLQIRLGFNATSINKHQQHTFFSSNLKFFRTIYSASSRHTDPNYYRIDFDYKMIFLNSSVLLLVRRTVVDLQSWKFVGETFLAYFGQAVYLTKQGCRNVAQGPQLFFHTGFHQFSSTWILELGKPSEVYEVAVSRSVSKAKDTASFHSLYVS